MNLLTEGIRSGAVTKTTLTRKLTLDGITRPYPVYRIRLDLLYYNDKNDRIATWISDYRSGHDGQMPDPADRDAYNEVIESFIVESNPEAIRKTRQNIELFEQREAGVVLADGRIIDGNRRFTCLRQLARKDGKFTSLDAVILDRSLDTSLKQIKMLELSIQHGEESKVDYNPVDRLVGVYTDIVETGLFTPEEYAYYTNETEADVRRRIETAEMMVEFLEYIKKPKQYFVIRDLQAVYPLEETVKLLKKCKTPEETESLKTAAFTNIFLQPAGDMSRFIRNMKSVIGSEHQGEFLKEQKEIAEKVTASIPENGKTDKDALRAEVRANEENTRALEESMDKALNRVRRDAVRSQLVLLAEKAAMSLESIDMNILEKMNEKELASLRQNLDTLERTAAALRERWPVGKAMDIWIY